MTGRVQTIRSNVSGNRPTGRQPGELYVNWADGQIGVINGVGGAQDFVGVRFFSTTASYVIGDFVVQGGQLYRAVAPSSGGAFVPTNWTQLGGSITINDAAPANPQPGQLWWDSVGGQLYVWYADPNTAQWVVAVNVANLLTPASKTTLGVVKVDGTTINAAPDGTISVATPAMNDNRIINGDMRIDQRNNGASGASTTAGGGYTVDRWKQNGSVAGRFNWGRNLNSGPVAIGFPCYLGTQSTVSLTLAAGDYNYITQRIEQDAVIDFWWGTPLPQPVTLSFMAWSSLTGTFSGAIQNAATDRSYPFTYSIPAANTWTKVVLTIPGDTAGTWSVSTNLLFDLGTGSIARGPANAWAAANYVGATGAVSVVGVTGATFYVTGVKLEIGSIATPFNRQSLAKSMADCERYYQTYNNVIVAGNTAASTGIFETIIFPSMRAQPTVVFGTISYSNASTLTADILNTNFTRLQATVTASGYGLATAPMQLSAEF